MTSKEVQIKYIPHHQINMSKWDACIDTAPNGLIYAYSWWLNHMAKNWDALVLNDYEVVMPLTWNRKWGIRYLYQPPISPQLGLFSHRSIEPNLVKLFLLETRKYFRFAEIFLNYSNVSDELLPHTNYVLDLTKPYTEIVEGYKNSLVKNLKRAANFNLEYKTAFDLKKVLDLYIKLQGNKTPHVKKADWERFEQLCFFAKDHKHLIVRAACHQEGNLLAASVLFYKSHRMYLLESITLPEGRQLEANHFLMDNIIREFSGVNVLFDFDGSEIPGIAYYYQTFGGINQPYYFHRHNNLPLLIKYFKSLT